jgi:hypothetical protein
MYKVLVAVQELPPKDGIGRIKLTWRSSGIAMREIRTTTGTHPHPGVEEFTTTEIVTYEDRAERDRLLRVYAPDAIGR